ncbi:MAG: helix-turn-helix transcriptional regulator [Clostridia bacterium]|nr:helix-turn-helix transcriptional regulator [Clostridia bacterium]
MTFNKIKKLFDIQTIVLAFDFKPLVPVNEPYEETYPFWQLFYVSRGEASILREGKEKRVSEGQVIFRAPDKKSTMLYPDDSVLYMGIIDFFCPSTEMSFFEDKVITLTPKEKGIISAIIKEAAVESESPSSYLFPELVSSELEAFLVRLYGRLNNLLPILEDSAKSNSKNQVSETVNKINSILEERRFSNISVEEIASILNETPNVIMKRYKKEMNESIMEHFLNLKLQTALQLINTSNMNFTEISELLSFSSVNYFSKFFKKRMGMTPTEYSREN